MKIDIITLFPSMFEGIFKESIISRALEKNIASIQTYDLRNWAIDERGTVDDRPYGGGVGMLLRPEPIFRAVEYVRNSKSTKDSPCRVVLLDAGGVPYTQKKAKQYAKLNKLILICGHYEGIDYRVHEYAVDEVISIGDYVLTGGEIPAMVIADSVIRLLPGVLEKEGATEIESFSHPTPGVGLEYPQFTRPEDYKGYKVPEVLLSGNHEKIEKWRQEQARTRTKKVRPDLSNK